MNLLEKERVNVWSAFFRQNAILMRVEEKS